MADKSLQVSTGGQTVVTVAVSGTTNTMVYAGAGRLCGVQILTAGSTNLRIWDAATSTAATTSNHVWTSIQTTVAGHIIDLQIPLANGLVVQRQADAPGYRLSFVMDTTEGR
jgi:hypothetical protein